MRLPGVPSSKRDSTAAISTNQWHMVAMDGDSGDLSAVMADVQAIGLHVFNDIHGHASWSLKRCTGVDVFDTIRNPGHTIELGVVLKVQQGVLNKIEQTAKDAPRSSVTATLLSLVSARLALLYSLHPHFVGIRKPNGDVLDKLRNSKLLATESVSLPPLLLLAIRGVDILEPAANLLIVTLQVCSFAYAPEATERMLNTWSEELQRLSTRLQADPLVLPPKKVAKPKQTKDSKRLMAEKKQLVKKVKQLETQNKALCDMVEHLVGAEDELQDESQDAAEATVVAAEEESACAAVNSGNASEQQKGTICRSFPPPPPR